MKMLIAVFFSLFFGLACAQGRPADDPVARFDFRSMGIAQVVQLIYSEAMPGSFVVDPDVLSDQRLVSFRYDPAKGDLKVFISAFFDSLGLIVTRRNGIDFIARKPVASAITEEKEVFIYRPRHRDGSYIVELLAPLFKGSFTSKRVLPQSPSEQGSNQHQRVAPVGSAAAMIDRKMDTIVFSGSAGEVEKLRKLIHQVDLAVGDVLVRGVLYEVQTNKADGSAFGLAVGLLGGKLGFGLGSLSVAPGDAFISLKNRSIDAVLSVLSTDSRFKAVSKPTLRVSSGGSGRFTVGQDVPVLGSVSYPGSGQAPVQSVTYQSSGVIYDVQPVIHETSIDVAVMQQVSSFVSTSTGVSGSPTLIKRELKSDLSLQDGEIVVMGGLTDSKDTDSESGPSFVPTFLRSRSSGHTGTEIILILQVTKI